MEDRRQEDGLRLRGDVPGFQGLLLGRKCVAETERHLPGKREGMGQILVLQQALSESPWEKGQHTVHFQSAPGCLGSRLLMPLEEGWIPQWVA